jgi:dTDP-4-amino-4,6-dideoxygalactose transaminase
MPPQSSPAHSVSTSGPIKYLVPDLPSADKVLPYLQRIDEARWYSNFGPLACEFEERLQSRLSERDTLPDAGRIHLTTLVSGHVALEVGLHLSGIGASKRVLVPAVTFASSALAVQHVGAEAVLSDVDPGSWTLTPEIAHAAAEHTKLDAIMPVSIYGVPLLSSGWDDFYVDTGIPVVIDAAAAIGSQTLPKYALVAHSLHATKPFGVGEGGILASRNPETIVKAKRYANFGMIDRISHTDGSNAKMSEYHAAVGLAQLDRWDDIIGKRRRLLQLYLERLERLAEYVSLQPLIEESIVSALMLLVKNPVAEALVAEGGREGISLHRTYLPPLYDHPYFGNLSLVNSGGRMLSRDADIAAKRSHMPNSVRLKECLVGVPFHPSMNGTDVSFIVDQLEFQLRRLTGPRKTGATQ